MRVETWSEVREALKGLFVGVSFGAVAGLVVVSQCCGCGAIVYSDDDADADSAEADEQLEAEPDASDDSADTYDTYDRGEAETSDEDDGWTDPAGEDGGDEAGGPIAICEDRCGYRNGYCQDGGPGSDYADCTIGTDCEDCGVRYVYPDGDVVGDVVP